LLNLIIAEEGKRVNNWLVHQDWCDKFLQPSLSIFDFFRQNWNIFRKIIILTFNKYAEEIQNY
jgi:hypothetical protein